LPGADQPQADIQGRRFALIEEGYPWHIRYKKAFRALFCVCLSFSA
jgi:hypothetical protein